MFQFISLQGGTVAGNCYPIGLSEASNTRCTTLGIRTSTDPQSQPSSFTQVSEIYMKALHSDFIQGVCICCLILEQHSVPGRGTGFVAYRTPKSKWKRNGSPSALSQRRDVRSM
ncbi:hypothetical protein C8034_v009413 [Colletotrichum sidae]|uniref:Uncharacterized protein n=1 Tax=Colletotrichum sidae TaxID=1347389 RepID=A0A4V3I3Q6_9PEZI|nr:hypothetical protein C8034_v009413 [Colletotrichum sidae]